MNNGNLPDTESIGRRQKRSNADTLSMSETECVRTRGSKDFPTYAARRLMR
jgi:hypothetical protein